MFTQSHTGIEGSLSTGFAMSYRFGFNGQEKNTEVSEGNYDFGARMYDDRIGRFMSVDAWASKYPWQSTYCGLDNNPIRIVDPTGNGGETSNLQGNAKDGYTVDVVQNVYLYSDGTNMDAAEKSIKDAQKVLNEGNFTKTVNADGNSVVIAKNNFIINVQQVSKY